MRRIDLVTRIFQVVSIGDFERLTEDEKLNIFTPPANEIRSVMDQKP